MTTHRTTNTRQTVARLIQTYGPANAKGIHLHCPEISVANAANVLRRGAESGLFAHLPAAPNTYTLTKKGVALLS